MRLNFLMAAGAAVFFGCGTADPAVADPSGRIVASIKPVHSLVSAVMAGVGEPRLIIRGTASPHTFSLRPSDATVLEDSRVVFLVDESLETTLAGPIDTLASKARVVMLSEAEGLVRRPFREGGAFEAHDHEEHELPDEDEGNDHGSDEGHGHHDGGRPGEGMAAHEDDHHGSEEPGVFDMHIWLDPVNAGAMVRMIATTLSEVDPANAAAYAANTQVLLHRLEDLTAEISAETEPVRARPFIVFHDGYRHFEDRFGLAAVGSVVVRADRSPGVRRIQELRDKVRELGATCVFAEVQFEPRLVDTIIEGTSARLGILDPLGTMTEDGPEAYFALLRTMAASFKDCLMSVAQGQSE